MSIFQGVAGSRDRHHLLKSLLYSLSGANTPQTVGEEQPRGTMPAPTTKPRTQSPHTNQEKALSKSSTSPKREQITNIQDVVLDQDNFRVQTELDCSGYLSCT